MSNLAEQLRAPFSPDVVSWRVGSTNKRKWEADKSTQKRGQVLAYIDARDVMHRLDEAVGPFGWQCEYVAMPNGTCCCRIGIAVEDDKWVWKSNGAGATDVEGEKGAYSDAFKRAAVLWGIGQYLYDLKSPWIALDDYWGIPSSEIPALQRLLAGTKEPSSRSGKDEFARIETGLRGCKNLKALATFWTTNQDSIGAMSSGFRAKLCEEKDRCKAKLTEGADA